MAIIGTLNASVVKSIWPYFLILFLAMSTASSATFNTFTFVLDYEYYWFENAWESQSGIHGPYSNIGELKADVFLKYKDDPDVNQNECGGIVFSDHGNHRVGMTMSEYSKSWRLEDRMKYYLDMQKIRYHLQCSMNGDGMIQIKPDRGSFLSDPDIPLMGYVNKEFRIDPFKDNKRAIHIYKKMGFEEIQPWDFTGSKECDDSYVKNQLPMARLPAYN